MNQSLTECLERHHRECDDLFATLEDAVSKADWTQASLNFALFRDQLEAHFRAEEEVLFPHFEEITGMTEGPTSVMRMEHESMRTVLLRIAEALKNEDEAEFAGESETLFVRMQQHNMKEEGVLYPMCDRRLANTAETLSARIQKVIAEAQT